MNTEKVIKNAAKVGAGLLVLAGGAIVAHKATNKGKHLKSNIDKDDNKYNYADLNRANPFVIDGGLGGINFGAISSENTFRPESFSSLKQAEAYDILLKTFDDNSRALREYIITDYDDSKDYEFILKKRMDILNKLVKDYKGIQSKAERKEKDVE